MRVRTPVLGRVAFVLTDMLVWTIRATVRYIPPIIYHESRSPRVKGVEGKDSWERDVLEVHILDLCGDALD